MGIGRTRDDPDLQTLFGIFNQRFRPSRSSDPNNSQYGGIAEMKALQSEFQIFVKGRRFVDSARLLGLGGTGNDPDKNWWFGQLTRLPQFNSDNEAENGDERIVNALIDNLAKPEPLPCFMDGHDGREQDPRPHVRAYVDRPLPGDDRDYMVISIPMRPASAGPSAH